MVVASARVKVCQSVVCSVLSFTVGADEACLKPYSEERLLAATQSDGALNAPLIMEGGLGRLCSSSADATDDMLEELEL
jgi:hypothetical protein